MSWQQLIAIKHEAREIVRENRERPIVECPMCGEVLQVKGNVFDCPWGHFRQTGSQRGAESV